MAGPRNTTIRDRDRGRIRRTNPPCHICGEPIDYTLTTPHPMSFVVDHVIPLARGGADDISNKAAAHRACNRDKSDKLPGEMAPKPGEPVETATGTAWIDANGVRNFRTSRQW